MEFIKTYKTSGTVEPCRFVIYSSEGIVAQASAATDVLLGVSVAPGTTTARHLDVVLFGESELEFGGTVAAGDYITADANGKGVSVGQHGQVEVKYVAGAAAGNITVTGVATTDVLLTVLKQDGTSGLFTDLTSEFSVTATNTINNTAGTNTTGHFLLVVYQAGGGKVAGAYALLPAVSGDIRPVLVIK